MAKAKSKYQFERVGTKPRKGDKVVSVDPEEANDAWGTPHTVVKVVDDSVFTRALKSDMYKEGAEDGKHVIYDRKGFSNKNWHGDYAFNRVLKRKKEK